MGRAQRLQRKGQGVVGIEGLGACFPEKADKNEAGDNKDDSHGNHNVNGEREARARGRRGRRCICGLGAGILVWFGRGLAAANRQDTIHDRVVLADVNVGPAVHRRDQGNAGVVPTTVRRHHLVVLVRDDQGMGGHDCRAQLESVRLPILQINCGVGYPAVETVAGCAIVFDLEKNWS